MIDYEKEVLQMLARFEFCLGTSYGNGEYMVSDAYHDYIRWVGLAPLEFRPELMYEEMLRLGLLKKSSLGHLEFFDETLEDAMNRLNVPFTFWDRVVYEDEMTNKYPGGWDGVDEDWPDPETLFSHEDKSDA